MDITALDLRGGVPPRVVDAAAIVSGHTVTLTGRRRVCSCGERQAAVTSATPAEWGRVHLSHAWPLVAKEPAESDDSFRERLTSLCSDAVRRQDEIDDALGLNKPIGPGESYPLITDEAGDASDLVEVLEQQLMSLALAPRSA